MSEDWRAQRDRALLILERESGRELRAEAAASLCELAEASATRAGELAPALPRLLADRQQEVRAAGLALAAQVLPPEEAQEVLARSLSDGAERVRVEAAGRLADLARPSTRGELARALEDTALPVRFEAARGMAALGHRAGLEVLIEALDHGDLCYRAVGALAELADPAALPVLRRLFHRWLLPAFERTQTAGAMARLGDAEGVAHLEKRAGGRWTPDRAMAVELLGEVKAGGALERLTAILGDARDPCRGAAARGLGRLGDHRSAGPLLRALEDAATPDDLRIDVAEGLQLLGALGWREAASRALARVAEPQARTELQRLLDEADAG